MTRARTKTPFDTIIATRVQLEMFAKHGDAMFKAGDKDQLLADALASITALMEFRNIINQMVALDVNPGDAARDFLA